MSGFIFVAFLLIVILLIYRGIVENKRKEQNLREKFLKQFGKANSRVWKNGELEKISYYAKRREIENLEMDTKCKYSTQTVDEITWNDLDMDSIYQQIAFTNSSLGDDYLYYLLKNPVTNQCGLEEKVSEKIDETNNSGHKVSVLWKREAKIDYLSKNPEVRVNLQVLFAKLGRVKEYSFAKYFEHLLKEEPRSNTKHYTMDLLIIISVLLMIYNVGIGLVIFFFLILYNIISYFKDKAYFEPYIASVRYLFKILDLAKDVVSVLPQEWKDEKDEVEKILNSMNKVRKNSFLVMSPGRMEGEGLELILDYLRMCFHLDIIKFNKMLTGIQQYQNEVWKLFEILGETDSCIAVACYRASMKKVCVPEFVQEKTVEMAEGYHPLVENPVTNSLRMDKNVLLTGSNASGKSTFLKTMGVNVILAQTIHTCLADKFRMPFCKIYTSMSLKDSIALKESYYLAEIKAMKRILDSAAKGNMVICMVDEVLRGTNTVERIAASTQILKSLSKENVLCMAATHDVELTRTLENEYDNYHFEESMEQDDVRFSYRLKTGRANSSNAINLLERLGYDHKLVKEAREMVNRFEQRGEWTCE